MSLPFRLSHNMILWLPRTRQTNKVMKVAIGVRLLHKPLGSIPRISQVRQKVK
jgi:hypothetical protein